MPAPLPAPRPRRATARVGFMVVALLAGAWLMYHFAVPSADKNTAPASRQTSASPVPPIAGPAYALQPGDRLLYHFTSDGTLTMGAAESGASATVLQIHESGRLSITVYAATATGWLLGCQWENIRLTLDNGRDPQNQTPADLAGAEIYVSLDKSGRIAQVQAPMRYLPRLAMPGAMSWPNGRSSSRKQPPKNGPGWRRTPPAPSSPNTHWRPPSPKTKRNTCASTEPMRCSRAPTKSPGRRKSSSTVSRAPSPAKRPWTSAA